MLKNVVLQWGEMPTSVAFIGIGEIMGWGNKAIEIRNVETGHLDGVFMHKKAQRLKFLCERNDKVYPLTKTMTIRMCFKTHFDVRRCFSLPPKVALHGKSISWFSISPAWPIGRFQMKNRKLIAEDEILRLPYNTINRTSST